MVKLKKISEQHLRVSEKDYQILGFFAAGELTADLEKGIIYHSSGLPVSTFPDHNGYQRIYLRKSGKLQRYRLARALLIYSTMTVPPVGSETLHLDHNPSNNSISNLSWGSHSDNIKASVQAGRWAIRVKNWEEAWIDFEKALEIHKLVSNGSDSVTKLAKEIGADPQTIKRWAKKDPRESQFYFKVQSPDGQIYEGFRLKRFCVENNLSLHSFNHIRSKRSKTDTTTSGWKVLK